MRSNFRVLVLVLARLASFLASGASRMNFVLGVCLLFACVEVSAQQWLVTRAEALADVFSGAVVETERVFLTPSQIERAESLSGEEIPSALLVRYVAKQDDQVVGRAYIDTHVVRTKRESLLISLSAEGLVKRIDVTAFLEPRDYMAPESWLGQYDGKALDDELNLRRLIRPIAGATLTAIATNDAARRVLAIDAVLEFDAR